MTILLLTSGTLGGGTIFNVPQYDTVALTGGTYTGGVMFNVAQNATIDLISGSTVAYGGTLTGTGSPTVQTSSGTLAVASESIISHPRILGLQHFKCAGNQRIDIIFKIGLLVE